MARGKAEDAGGLTPAKDDNAAAWSVRQILFTKSAPPLIFRKKPRKLHPQTGRNPGISVSEARPCRNDWGGRPSRWNIRR